MLEENIVFESNNNYELQELKNKVLEWNNKAKIIRDNFNFFIPNYIIDEIILCEKNKDYINLYYLINCAVLNNKISKSNGLLLKKEYTI